MSRSVRTWRDREQVVPSMPPPVAPGEVRLLVGNLPPGVSDAEVLAFFARTVQPAWVGVVSRLAGMAWVDVRWQDAERAVALAGERLRGRRLEITALARA